jgi:hypothetical protein
MKAITDPQNDLIRSCSWGLSCTVSGKYPDFDVVDFPASLCFVYELETGMIHNIEYYPWSLSWEFDSHCSKQGSKE